MIRPPCFHENLEKSLVVRKLLRNIYYRQKNHAYGRRPSVNLPISLNEIPHSESHLNIGILSSGHLRQACVIVSGFLPITGGTSVLFNCGEGVNRSLTYFTNRNGRPFMKPTLAAITKSSADNVSELLVFAGYDGRHAKITGHKSILEDYIRLYGQKVGDQAILSLKSMENVNLLEGPFTDLNVGPFKMDSELLQERERLQSLKYESNNKPEDTFPMAYILKTEALYTESLILQKLMDMDIKNAIDISRLVNATENEQVLLSDGRYVAPKQLKHQLMVSSRIIVLECPSVNHIHRLLASKKIFPPDNDKDTVDEENTNIVVVHMTPYDVIQSEQYQCFIRRFGSEAKHILLHEKTAPHLDPNALNVHARLNMLSSELYPPLLSGIPSSQWLRSENMNSQIIHGETGMMVQLLNQNDKITTQMENVDLDWLKQHNRKKYNTELVDNVLEDIYAELENKKKTMRRELPEYPAFCFLGTSGVSLTLDQSYPGILLYTSDNTALLLDCGSGTSNQLFQAYGSKATDVFMDIKAVFISHSHADHQEGLLPFILHRREAFFHSRREYTPLEIILPRNFCRSFFRYNRFYRANKNLHRVSVIPAPHFNRQDMPRIAELLNLREFQTVPVVHVYDSYGVCLHLKNGLKVVYSGDCAMSPTLIKAGKDCNVLIHECTYDNLKDNHDYRHSNYDDAVYVSEEMNAEYTILTHMGYSAASLHALYRKNMFIAYDFLQVKYKDLYKLHAIQEGTKLLFGSEDMAVTKYRMQIVAKRHKYPGGEEKRREERERILDILD